MDWYFIFAISFVKVISFFPEIRAIPRAVLGTFQGTLFVWKQKQPPKKAAFLKVCNPLRSIQRLKMLCVSSRQGGKKHLSTGR
jgi:hypothetical protein